MAAQQIKKKSAEMEKAIVELTGSLADNLDKIIAYAQKAPAFDVQDVLKNFSRHLYDTMASYDIDCKFTPKVSFIASNEDLAAMSHHVQPEVPPTPHRSTEFATAFGAPPVEPKNGSAADNRNRVAPRVLFHPEGQREITEYMPRSKRSRTNGGRRKTRKHRRSGHKSSG